MKFNGPIPGENYLTDTKNYAWHRPPDLVDYDESVGYMMDKIDEPEQIEMVFAMLQIDAHVTTVVSTLLLQAISKGKFSIDLALLISGPLARYIAIQADNAGIKYEMGVEDKDRLVVTPTLLKAALGIIEQPESENIVALREEAGPIGTDMAQEEMVGLMAPTANSSVAPEEEQAAMLGQQEEQAPEEEPEEELA